MGRTQTGFVFPMSLVMLGLMSLLVTGYLLLITSELQMAKNGLERSIAYSLCEVGIAKAIEALSADPNWTTGFSNVEFPSGSGRYYSVTISKTAEQAILTASGTAGLSQRSIKVTAMVPAVVTMTQPVRIDQWETL